MSEPSQRIRAIDERMTALEDRAAEAIARFEIHGWNFWPALRLWLGYQRLTPLEKGHVAPLADLLESAQLMKRADSFRGRVVFVTTSAAYRQTDDGWAVNDRLRTALGALPDDTAVVLGSLRSEEASAHRQGKLVPPLDLPLDAILPASRAARLRAAPHAAAVALRWRRGLREVGIEPGNALRSLARVLTEASVWEELLTRLQPRHVVVMVASYGQEGLTLACKRQGIPISEYQHAVIYPEHVGYNYAASLAGLRHRFLVPDSLLLYGPFWRDALLARKFYGERQLVVSGHPALARANPRGPEPRDGRTRVLVCTSMADSRKFGGFVAAYLRESPHAAALHFVVKQHPRESGELRAEWSRTVADWPGQVEVSNRDTYDEMSRCDVQLTGQSSTLYEGAYYGLFSYAIPDPVFGFEESSIWPREAVEIIDWSYRGALESRSLSSRQAELSNRMWRPFDATAFRARVLGDHAL